MQLVTPYLHFDGNCREAMTFYKDAIGGDLSIQTVGESPAAQHMPKDVHNQVMHARLGAGNEAFLMASDTMGHMKVNSGNGISLALDCRSDAEIKSRFEKLSAGGKVNQPLAEQFWGATYGQLTDKFGIDWMLNYQKNPQ